MTAKPILFYLPGTHTAFDVFGTGLFDYLPEFNTDPFPTMVDPDLWDYQRVTVPDAIWPLSVSISDGVTNLSAAITAAAGRKFALAGVSQGAAIITEVWRSRLNGGALSSRRQDLLAVTCFGNPYRGLNTWPGARWAGSWDIPGSQTGGHGCFPPQFRLTTAPTLWWDFANDQDIIASTGDSTVGQSWAGLVGWFSASTTPLESIAALASQNWIDAAYQALQVGAVGHIAYPTTPPPGYTSGGTSYDIAAAYLNDAALAWRNSNYTAWTALAAGATIPPPP